MNGTILNNNRYLRVMPSSAISIFNDYASEYAERFDDQSTYADALMKWAHLLPERAEIIDIGCGPGNVAGFVLHHFPRLHWHGVDGAENMIRIAQQRLPQVQFEVSDPTCFSLKKKYNGIMCSFLLPYLSREETQHLLTELALHCLPPSPLYISCNYNSYDQSGIVTNSKGDQVNMYYYNETELNDLLSSAGFSMVYSEVMESKQPQELIVIAHKII